MGLDCVPLGRAKPGLEAEWQTIMAELYAGKQISDETRERLIEISIAAYEAVGAPIVGTDSAADAWALKHKPDDSEATDAEFLQQMAGYRVLDLVPKGCAGLPKYCNAPLYDEVDETSFRGAFLNDCEPIIGEELLARAWTDFMSPEEAVAYGQALLEAAAEARQAGSLPQVPAEKKKGLIGKLFGGSSKKPAEREVSLKDQLDILEAAGAWYRFWGELGHPIWANY